MIIDQISHEPETPPCLFLFKKSNTSPFPSCPCFPSLPSLACFFWKIGLERERLVQLGGKRGLRKEAAVAVDEKTIALWRLQEEDVIGGNDGDRKEEQGKEEIQGEVEKKNKDEELQKNERQHSAHQQPCIALARALSCIAKTYIPPRCLAIQLTLNLHSRALAHPLKQVSFWFDLMHVILV